MNQRPTVLFEAPLMTLSGYGTHSRQILDAFLKTNQFEVYANPLRWGNCAWIQQHPHLEAYKQVMNNYNLATQHKKQDFDIYVMVSIPNEFQRKGKINFLVTAGIEADRMKAEWIEGANRADLVIVPSEFSSEALKKTSFTVTHPQTKQTIEQRFHKPIAIVPEGVEPSIYHPDVLPLSFLDSLATNFNFLVVGQWGNGSFGEDRKNISQTIRWFCEEFKDNPDVGLILKIHGSNPSKIDKRICENKLKSIKENFPDLKCKIYLLHGQFQDQQLAALYTHPKVKALLNLGRECWWLPGIEAAACNLPIISINWGGPLDYLNLGKYTKINWELRQVPEAITRDGFIPAEAQWAVPDEVDFKKKIRKFYHSPNTPKEWAVALGARIRDDFNLEKVQKLFLATIFEYIQQVQTDPLIYDREYQDFKKELGPLDGKNILFVMPQHAGDVFLATATVAALQEKFSDHKIYFATNNHYWPILENNPNIHKVINYRNLLTNINLMEKMFDLVYEPFLHIQMVGANWVQKGTGRTLKDEIAAQCSVAAQDCFIPTKQPKKELPKQWIVFAPGKRKDQWAARNYTGWQDVIDNLLNLFPNKEVEIIQLGREDEPLFQKVLDFRGYSLVEQAYLVQNSIMFLGIDSYNMHLASHFSIPTIALFGSSYPNSTGILPNKAKELKTYPTLNIKEHNFEDHTILLEPLVRGECKDKACYLWKCLYE